MKPTPVTRKEQFLYALGAIQTLTPITREEMYLGNLCGQNNVLPYPVTRYEQYLYKMCGGSIDVPTPVTRLEMFLYRACDFEYETPTPVTREEIYWDEYIKAYVTIKTLTGTLPLTFRTSETALRSWTIYGNNTPHIATSTGTLPLTFTAKAGNAVDWVINGNDDVGENLFDVNSDKISGYVNDSGNIVIGGNDIYTYDYIAVTAGVEYTYKAYSTIANPRYTTIRIAYYDETKTFISREYTLNGGLNAKTITTPNNCAYVRLSVDTELLDVLLIKGSTAPDHYIPYQQGVGERTENLFDKTAFVFARTGSVLNDNGVEQASAASGYTAPFIDADENTIYRLDGELSQYSMGGANGYRVYYYNGNTFLSRSSVLGNNTQKDFTTPNNCNKLAIQCQFTNDYPILDTIMLTKGSTAPSSYVPYGYEIPISVNGNAQTFYIGSSPLTAGQSISKTSTGIDLELFEGENTVSTTLYNKPETSITYRDYLGVGEYVNGQWQIPLTLSHITDNLFDKDATDTDNGYEDDTRTYWRNSIYGLQLFIEPNTDYCTSEYMSIIAGKDYYPADIDINRDLFSAVFYTAEKTRIYTAFSSADKITAPENAAYIRVCVQKSKLNSAMLTTKPTSEYIPHKQSTDYTIPIDAPLTEGQSVSDTLTITTFEGENVLDTTLDNKPQMTITYKGG